MGEQSSTPFLCTQTVALFLNWATCALANLVMTLASFDLHAHGENHLSYTISKRTYREQINDKESRNDRNGRFVPDGNGGGHYQPSRAGEGCTSLEAVEEQIGIYGNSLFCHEDVAVW